MGNTEESKKGRSSRFLLSVGALLIAFVIGAGTMRVVVGDQGEESKGDGSTSASSTPVEPGIPATASVGSTEVSLPIDAVESPATLSVTPGDEAPPFEAEIAGSPVDISLSQTLEASAEIKFGGLSETDLSEDSLLVPAFLDERKNDWLTVDLFSQVDSAVVARTTHFTPFALLRFTGLRATEPTCQKPVSDRWLTYKSSPGFEGDGLLLACAEADGKGGATIKIVNNRSYLMPVWIPPSVKFDVGYSSSLDEAALQALNSVTFPFFPARNVLVPGGGQLTLHVPGNTGQFVVNPHPNQGVAAFGLIADQLAELGLGSSTIPDVLKCLYKGGAITNSSGRRFSAGDVTELVVHCLRPLVGRNKTTLAKVVKIGSALLLAKTMANIYESNLDQFGAEFQRIRVNPPTAQTMTTNESSPQQQAGMAYIGAITLSLPGRKAPAVQADYWVDQPVPSGGAEPPEEVLSSCNADYSMTEAHSVYVEGKFVATNMDPNFPQVFSTASTRPVGGYIPWGAPAMAVEDDGYWTCQGTSYTLDPGESATGKFWLLIPALDDENPTLTEGIKDSWSMEVPTGTPISRTTPSGPGAVNCDSYRGDDLLMLYGRPPFILKGSRMSAGSDVEALCR